MKSNIQLLSTISLDHSLIEKVKAMGIGLDAVSFIEVNTFTDALQPELEELCGLPLTAVFTSANAVRAIKAIVQASNPGWKIYCIGSATKNSILECFDADAIKGTANNAADLAEVILDHDVLEVVFFCGDKRMDMLPDILLNADINVHEIVVYQTIETPQVATKAYDGILFFSPSAVNSFFSVNTLGPATVLFAIGESTAEAIKKHTQNKIIVSKTPSKENVIVDAIAYFAPDKRINFSVNNKKNDQ